jgi:hypothetical protein
VPAKPGTLSVAAVIANSGYLGYPAALKSLHQKRLVEFVSQFFLLRVARHELSGEGTL